ncbi:MAG TPA: SMP-30/gluconolactonase/LRE family protein [Limnobacter sp.]|nr:SMP-30/gluconolactonase/LRE family protein [Limnobacter sp.]
MKLEWQALPFPFCSLPESPRYAHESWMWLDIESQLLYCLNSTNVFDAGLGKLQQVSLPDEIACILPTAKAGRLVGLGRQGGWLIENGTATHYLPAPFNSGLQRFNDGRADSEGRIWISTLVDARTPADAGLYCITSGRAELKVPELIVGNGLAFSPTGDCAFLSDTRHRCIWRFSYNSSTGELGDRTLVRHYTEGTARPDGACFSRDGSYWVAILEGYRLDRYSSAGDLIESIEIPLARPTMPCFGGADGKTLLVCGAKPAGEFQNKPGFESTSLIACETGFQGMPEAFALEANLVAGTS